MQNTIFRASRTTTQHGVFFFARAAFTPRGGRGRIASWLAAIQLSDSHAPCSQ